VAEAIPIRGPRADRARRVADVLRQQIHAAAYQDELPTESELAAEFSVSHTTIREALGILKQERLIATASACTYGAECVPRAPGVH
jgi:GntR family transcriptional regulator